METPQAQKQSILSSELGTKTLPVRIRRCTKERIDQMLVKINNKDYGRKVRADEVIMMAVAMLRPEHLQQLQDKSLTNGDRLARLHQQYMRDHGQIARDAFIGLLLKGDAAAMESASRLPSPA